MFSILEMQHLCDHLHIANFVREEFQYRLVAPNLADCRQDDKKGSYIIANCICLRLDLLTDIHLQKAHYRGHKWV